MIYDIWGSYRPMFVRFLQYRILYFTQVCLKEKFNFWHSFEGDLQAPLVNYNIQNNEFPNLMSEPKYTIFDLQLVRILLLLLYTYLGWRKLLNKSVKLINFFLFKYVPVKLADSLHRA